MKKRRLSKPFKETGGDSKSENVEEHEKKYIYPSIVNSPIMVHKDKVIYGFGNCLLVFNLKENNFIRKVEDHTCTVRSLDVNAQRKYFLTTGDDKMIMIYDDNWVLCKKIIHKKKIVKAYFLKYTNKVEEEKKIEILFIDKYGDVYVYDVSSFLSGDTESSVAVGMNHIHNSNDNKKSQKDDDKMIVKLSYLSDALNEIQEKDEDLFFMKDFEYVKQDDEGNVDNSKSDNEMKIDQKSIMNNNCDYFTQYNNINEMEKIKDKLKKHYYECFQNEKYIYPILTYIGLTNYWKHTTLEDGT
ncbi:WD repeat-containing protein, putative [Plasmodium ovale wallikeri]|uniref:WD repeat-containing protein, putative n=1 Tax=Plasmodium ovale wallikeri TaxID=864142 RepID=A0A1A8ZSK9_PLAOA|nr:WD repeat-containing protein, putative [Plasmodium ovale wallikeri]SBT46853.1 WD repeat-containing protein, putative [Plasmodium ovale wallikeri]